MVNQKLRVIQLAPGTTKNKDGRNLPFYGFMEEYLDKQEAVRQAVNLPPAVVAFQSKSRPKAVLGISNRTRSSIWWTLNSPS